MTLREWRSKFDKQYKQYIAELAEHGRDVAQQAFDSADPAYGNTDATVAIEYDGTTDFRIVATGEDVMFMEFGTGVETIVIRDTVQSEVDIRDGSWSESVGGEYAKYGDYWHWHKQRFTGTPPMCGMQDACAEMEMYSPTIATKVFHS